MIALLIAQGLLAAEINPPLIFVGEPFTFDKPQNAATRDPAGVSLFGNRGVVRNQKAEFWLTVSRNSEIIDAALVQVPTATVPRWNEWPRTSGYYGGAIFIIQKDSKLALVPMRGNYGICIFENKERRYAPILSLDLAVRSGPQHVRPFVADFVYSGQDSITLYSRPDNVISVVLRITPSDVSLNAVALFAQRGTIGLLGVRRAIDLKQGQKLNLMARF